MSVRAESEIRLRNAVVTCEIKVFRNYFNIIRRRLSEIILFQRAETCLNFFLKLFQRIIAAREYFPTCSMSPK